MKVGAGDTASAQIEGTQPSLSDLLPRVLDKAPGAPIDDGAGNTAKRRPNYPA
ncbi:MAG: hypothetical protein U1A72_15100 [Sulfuritalea sp.]|nr:hypothetical protein [Sulfuritalea sp.]